METNSTNQHSHNHRILELDLNEPIIKEFYDRHHLSNDTPSQVPHFILQKVTRKFGGIDAKVLQVVTKDTDAAYMKRILSILGERNMLPAGKFIPSGLHLLIGVDQMKNILREHNKHVSEITVVGIEGISSSAMKTIIKTTTGPNTLQEIIRSSVPSISSIEQTNSTTTKGKWFIIVKKTDERSLHQWIQGPLCSIFKSIPQEHYLPGYDGPQRAGSNNNNSIVGNYTTVLLQSISPALHTTDKYDKVSSRPQKRQIINLLDDQEFPSLSQPTQSPAAPASKPTQTPHAIPPTQSPSVPSSVDFTALLDSKVATLQTQLHD